MQSAIAGRHGSYMTQFTRGRIAPKYRTRAELRTAHSKKALDRRLVLPMDAHNWTRAFEVLGAGYARLGRAPEHYQQVIRDMIQQEAPAKRTEMAAVIDQIRDQAYAGEIPTNSSLWVTLVWAYCRLQQSEGAITCFQQARRRAVFSPATAQHMAELLLPVLCRSGRLAEARDLEKEFFHAAKNDSERGAPAARSSLDAAAVRQLLAEAAARSGEWSSSLGALSSPTEAEVTGPLHTVHSLFLNDPMAAPTTADQRDANALGTSQYQQLSPDARNRLFHRLCECGQPAEAVACWRAMHGPWEGGVATKTPLAEDICALMNVLAEAGEHDAVLDIFCVYHLGRPWTTVTDRAAKRTSDTEAAPRRVPLSPVALSLVFSIFPRTEVEVVPVRDCGTDRHSPLHTDRLHLMEIRHPERVVQLLDALLMECDDMVITDYVMDAVGPALRQLGHCDRLLQLLRHAPLFVNGRCATPMPTPSLRALKKRLVHLVYYLHCCTTVEMRYMSLAYLPFLFPPEVFRHLPPPEELPESVRSLLSGVARASQQRTEDLADEERYMGAQKKRVPTSVLPNRQHYFPARSATELTESQERQMQKDAVGLHNARQYLPFRGDADKDPRPPPKGLHDTASGWNFCGRGGEMVFSNNHRLPHPFSMHPKVMRSLADPYRGWNHKQNSSWAHRESVVKWNGKSAV